jgi:hypothetical protein
MPAATLWCGRRCFYLHQPPTPIPTCLPARLSAHPPARLPAALLNVFGVFIGLEKDDSRTFAALAQTDCLLYTWSLDELNTMATQLAPAGGRTL